MAEHKYDIFISYRRDGGAQYARILQLELEKRGYRVFLDYEELTDGVFGDNIRVAIKDAPVFMLVLSAHYLDRCKNEGDWVREEIMLAIEQRKHFVPVNPDNTFDGIPADIPDEIKQIVSSHQHSDVNFGQLLGASIDKMVQNRIRPFVKPVRRKISQSKLFMILACVCLIAAFVGGCYTYYNRENEARKVLMAETALDGQHYLNWSEGISLEQLEAVNHILENMVKIEGGTFLMGAAPNTDGSYDEDMDVELETPQTRQTVETFWMCKYEVSVGEWCSIMEEKFDEQQADMPQTNVSFDDCLAFCERLSNLTGLDFRLPTEAEWEYAARGGITPDSTKYAGRTNPDEVAWYEKNSSGKSHICDATNSPMHPNGCNLYDMSGNVSEWCDTEFRPYRADVPVIDPEAKVIRGGNYDSEPYAITVYHREPMNAHEKAPAVGLRLVIGNN